MKQLYKIKIVDIQTMLCRTCFLFFCLVLYGHAVQDTVLKTYLSMMIYKNYMEAGGSHSREFCLEEYNIRGCGIDYMIPGTIWASTPTFHVIKMNKKEIDPIQEQVVLFTNQGKQLFMMVVRELLEPTTPGWPSYFQCFSPSELYISQVDFTGKTTIGIYSMNRINNINEKILMVIGVDSLKLLLVTINNSTVTTIDTIQLTRGKNNQKILKLTNGVGDSSMWVTGTKGLVRRVVIESDTLISETVYDISSREDVLCYGDEFIGTTSGSIYKLVNNVFVIENQLSNSPIHNINSKGAVGDNSTFLINDGNGWRYYTFGNSNYTHFNTVGLPFGKSIELFDNKGNYYLHTYLDSPTGLKSTIPDSLMTNNGNFVFNGSTSSEIKITLIDPDDNTKTPTMILYKKEGKIIFLDSSIFYNKTPNNTHTYLGYNYFNEQLGSDEFSINLKQDSLNITCSYTYLSLNPFSGMSRLTSSFIKTLAWELGDSLIVHINSDTLRFIYQIETGLNKDISQNTSIKNSIYIASNNGTSYLHLPNFTPYMEHLLITIYNLKGVGIFEKRIHNRSTINLTFLDSGIFIVKATIGDKKIIKKMMQVK